MEVHVLIGTERDNDLSLCFSILIRRNLLLTDHVTASAYLCMNNLLCSNNFIYSFLKNSPAHKQSCILVFVNKNV